MVSDGVSAEKSFRMKQNDRFLSRVMAKETCVANSSSSVFYYGQASVAVPFTWESQPGTPKHPLMSDQTSLPPLTPPPSYYSNSNSTNANRTTSKLHNLFSTIFPRKKAHVSPSSSRFSSSTSSSSSSSFSSWSLLYSSPTFSMSHKDQGDLSFSRSTSPTSPPGILFKRKASTGFRGCYPFGNVKNAILNILG